MFPFTKAHALGNDYIVLEEKQLPAPLTPQAIKRLCDRNKGIGSDGILLEVGSSRADFGLRIYNPDGSEAEKSGNGLRIFAHTLFTKKKTTAPSFTIEIPENIVPIHFSFRGDNLDKISVGMGKPTFLSLPKALEIEGTLFDATALSMGNPHCVILKENLNEEELRYFGPLIERHPFFPKRTNVQFVRVFSSKRLDLLIWERGAGYTLASGSSACAAAALCYARGLIGNKLDIHMPGGSLSLNIQPDSSLFLEGNAEIVYEGISKLTWSN